MKVALYIYVSVMLFGLFTSNMISTYLFGYSIELHGRIDVLYKSIIFIIYLGLSILFLIYLFEYKTSFVIKLFIVILNIFYIPIISLTFFFSILGKWEDLNYNYSKLDKSEQIVLQLNSGIDIDFREIYVYNLHPNIKLVKLVDSIELNGVWIKNEYMSDKLDTINYKNFMYKSEYNN